MLSNKILWTNWNWQNRSASQNAALDFIHMIQDTVPNFDFSALAAEFSKLPELNSSDEDTSKLSLSAKNIFEKIDLIHGHSPEIGLKTMTILVCNIECAFYRPKLKEIVLKKLNNYLLCDAMPRRIRLEWGVFCWKNWPVKHSRCGENEFVAPLLKMVVEESSVDPKYTLGIYDQLHDKKSDNDYIFNKFKDDPEDFLLFARNVKDIRPEFLIDALMEFIRNGKLGFGRYTVEVEKLKAACNELFELFMDNNNISIDKARQVLATLILYSYPELPWYQQLHEKLWAIINTKIERNEQFAGNHFIVSINAPKDSWFISDIRTSYKDWVNNYKNQEWLRSCNNTEWFFSGKGEELAGMYNIASHARTMLDFINRSLHASHPQFRNKSFAEPVNNQLTEDTIVYFWEMLEYLEQHDFELYLYALEAALEKDVFVVKETEEIGNQSKQLLIAAFEEYCTSNVEKAAQLVAYMIERSMYSTIKIPIREVLDIIYPVLLSINSDLAIASLKEGKRNESSHMGTWNPRVLKSQING